MPPSGSDFLGAAATTTTTTVIGVGVDILPRLKLKARDSSYYPGWSSS